MFGPSRIRAAKSTPRKPPSRSRFAFIRLFIDRCYRDPYRWGLFKCVIFFATSVLAAKSLAGLDILPNGAYDQVQQAAY